MHGKRWKRVQLPPDMEEPYDQNQDAADEPYELDEAEAGQAELIAGGDIEAFKALFDAFFDRLYRYGLRYLRSPEEAKDLVHDVFLQVWRHRRRIGLERDLRTYLYAMTRNHALDRLKHRKVEDRFAVRHQADVEREDILDSPEAERDLESRELAAAIQQAIDTLPQRQREVLRLRWQDHLSYEEIATTLGISPKTVAIHLSRGLRHLREALPHIIE